MEDNVPMPSLDAVSISKPFYKSWTSQAEVNHRLDLAFDLIIFAAESIPFAHSASQAPQISAVQHLASKCVPWPVISNGCQSESQQQSETFSAVFWKSSILQGKSIFKANVEMLSPVVSCGLVMWVFPPISWLPISILFLPPAPELCELWLSEIFDMSVKVKIMSRPWHPPWVTRICIAGTLQCQPLDTTQVNLQTPGLITWPSWYFNRKWRSGAAF